MKTEILLKRKSYAQPDSFKSRNSFKQENHIHYITCIDMYTVKNFSYVWRFMFKRSRRREKTSIKGQPPMATSADHHEPPMPLVPS